jgi:hypothetical protein
MRLVDLKPGAVYVTKYGAGLYLFTGEIRTGMKRRISDPPPRQPVMQSLWTGRRWLRGNDADQPEIGELGESLVLRSRDFTKEFAPTLEAAIAKLKTEKEEREALEAREQRVLDLLTECTGLSWRRTVGSVLTTSLSLSQAEDFCDRMNSRSEIVRSGE